MGSLRGSGVCLIFFFYEDHYMECKRLAKTREDEEY